MRNPDELPKKKRWQQGFAVIYLVLVSMLSTTVFDDYNVIIVATPTIMVYILLYFLIGVYVDKKSK
ncbi:hypothetical protein [Halobacillus ihumii]|uniref:hypothetical protein n=1 Tax=Halobacillus ihumii TaxID=2686092 RepID=UPI0013D87B03|nr:hypothetical protein [Halobacillus ihumii]